MDQKYIVYTSVVGRDDALRDDQETGGAQFIAFVDEPKGSKVWSERPAYSRFKSPRRNSRAPKILSHQFVVAEYSLWMDATIALRVPMQRVVDDWLEGCDLAVFTHESRSCTFAEADVCSTRLLDDPSTIQSQVEKYRGLGLKVNGGLARCAVIARRHNKTVETFNNLWWSEHCSFSVRDQISFMYAVRESGVRCKIVPETIFVHPYFSINSRPARREIVAPKLITTTYSKVGPTPASLLG